MGSHTFEHGDSSVVGQERHDIASADDQVERLVNAMRTKIEFC